MAVTINGRDVAETPSPEPPKPSVKVKPPKIVQLISDGPDQPLLALDNMGKIWRFVSRALPSDPVTGFGTGYERYWEPFPGEWRAE